MTGDAYGFGAFNLARINSPAPDPIFSLNTGYDPPDDSDSNQDKPQNWAEDEGLVMPGIDTHFVNPIPAGELGQGKYFAVEFGASVTAEFRDPADNSFQVGGVPNVMSGVNLKKAKATPGLSGGAIAAMTVSMLIAGAAVVRRQRNKA